VTGAAGTDPLRILAGPTGVGKSDLALDAARRFGGGIVSADSMQVYRGLVIGTAQPSADEQREIEHRLVGHVDPREGYDAARFIVEAEAAIAEFHQRGLLPLVVGGTGMYLKSLTEGLFEGPSRDPALRRRLEAEAREQGLERLYERLRAVDADSARRILPGDALRIIRALEVHELTGRPLSWWHRESRKHGPRHTARYVVVTRDREELLRRIEARARRMLEAGWIEEARALLDAGIPPEAPAFRALGYREILMHLRGELPRSDLPDAICRVSRQYAKRQLTWFRAVPGAVWINLSERTPSEAARDLARAWALPE
jgi:tRNA dimethylallyltransferase